MDGAFYAPGVSEDGSPAMWVTTNGRDWRSRDQPSLAGDGPRRHGSDSPMGRRLCSGPDLAPPLLTPHGDRHGLWPELDQDWLASACPQRQRRTAPGTPGERPAAQPHRRPRLLRPQESHRHDLDGSPCAASNADAWDRTIGLPCRWPWTPVLFLLVVHATETTEPSELHFRDCVVSAEGSTELEP